MNFKSIVTAVCTCLAVVYLNADASTIYSATPADLANLHNIFTSLSITTDGTIGGLDTTSKFADVSFTLAPNICATTCTYDWKPTNASAKASLTSSFFNGNPAFLATSTGLYVDYDGASANFTDSSGGYLDVNMFFVNYNVGTAAGSVTSNSEPGLVYNEDVYALFLAGITTVPPVVNAVPLPASIWLFSSGLLGLIEVARRKMRSEPPPV